MLPWPRAILSVAHLEELTLQGKGLSHICTQCHPIGAGTAPPVTQARATLYMCALPQVLEATSMWPAMGVGVWTLSVSLCASSSSGAVLLHPSCSGS